jgi:hypothetical protein
MKFRRSMTDIIDLERPIVCPALAKGVDVKMAAIDAEHNALEAHTQSSCSAQHREFLAAS